MRIGSAVQGLLLPARGMRTGLWRTYDSTCKSPDNSRRLIRLSEKGLSATFRRDERTKLDGGCLARLLWISESFLQGGLESFSEVRLRLIHLDAQLRPDRWNS